MAARGQAPETSVDAPPDGEVLDAIGDELARRILAAVSREPRSAKELNERFDTSLPTIYHRIRTLEDRGLVRSQTRVVADGSNYDVFEPTFDALVVSLDDESFNVRLFREGRAADRFAALWEELGR